MNRTYRIFALSETITPCTHADRSEGNESLVARRVYHTPEGARAISHLSGNAIRQRLVRGVGARFLIERWGLAGKLDLRILNFLLHGGNLTESSARTDTSAIATMHALFPLLRLMGGALPNTILPGTLIAWEGLLVCREHADRLRAISPAGWEVPDTMRPAEDFIAGYQYTRSDAAKTAVDLTDPNEPASDSGNLMIYSGQCVIPGAHFAHGFVVKNASELELGALMLSLRLWQASGGTIGGMAAKGHGRLHTLLAGDIPDDDSDLVEAYVAHIDSKKEEGISWLTKTFLREPKDESAKGKKRASKKTEEPLIGGAA